MGVNIGAQFLEVEVIMEGRERPMFSFYERLRPSCIRIFHIRLGKN